MVVNCLTQSKYRTQCERRKNEWASSISTYSSVRYLSTSGARLQLCQTCPDPRTRFPLDWRFESVHKYLHHVSHVICCYWEVNCYYDMTAMKKTQKMFQCQLLQHIWTSLISQNQWAFNNEPDTVNPHIGKDVSFVIFHPEGYCL